MWYKQWRVSELQVDPSGSWAIKNCKISDSQWRWEIWNYKKKKEPAYLALKDAKDYVKNMLHYQADWVVSCFMNGPWLVKRVRNGREIIWEVCLGQALMKIYPTLREAKVFVENRLTGQN